MELSGQIIDKNPNAPVLVLFGGSPLRRQEVINLISEIGNLTIYGTLSEEEGLAKLESLNKVDLVLIGGRYDENQRIRIQNYVTTKFPNAKVTQPGYDYQYTNNNIKQHIINLLNINDEHK